MTVFAADEVETVVDAVRAVDVRVSRPDLNIVALRAVRPRKEWLAGSSGVYASASTTIPPTPSTSNVAPIRSGAISCTLRAKNERPRS